MTGRDLPRQKVGRWIWPRTINRFAEAVEDRSRGQLLSGFGLALDRRVRGERGFFVRLSGAASPYSWAEVYGQVAGSTFTWVTMPSGRSGTANAYEQNSIAGLDGKVVKLVATEFANVWRFGFSRRTILCNWTFTVRGGCNSELLAGATVNLRQSGVLIATGTTDISGVAIIDVPAGTYDVEVIDTAGYGYSTYTASVAHTCSQSTTITLSVDVDHFCETGCGNCLSPPNVVNISWTYPAGWTGTMWPNEALTWNASAVCWVGSTVVNGTSNQALVCYPSAPFYSPGSRPVGGGGPAGFCPTASNCLSAVCSPFSITGGNYHPPFSGPDPAHWSVTA
jgi:hypothetical protein